MDTPETLDFWFDFLDITGGELDKFSVKNIGQRTKAKTDLSVKAIKYRDTPPILFYEKKDGEIPSSIDNSGDYSIIILEEGGAKDFLSISS